MLENDKAIHADGQSSIVFHYSLPKFCVRYSSLWFAHWTQKCLVVKKSEKLEIWLTFDHRIHAVVNEKKTYEFFLLSKLKVKMASILYFRKRFQ